MSNLLSFLTALIEYHACVGVWLYDEKVLDDEICDVQVQAEFVEADIGRPWVSYALTGRVHVYIRLRSGRVIDRLFSRGEWVGVLDENLEKTEIHD